MRIVRLLIAAIVGLVLPCAAAAAEEDPLALGAAGHAFDHLGGIGDQAPAAAASGATIIYCTGFGQAGYEGWPAPDELKATGDQTAAYLAQAKAKGIRLAVGYLCATSIVHLDSFDRNWPAEFRAKVSAPPARWLQGDAEGKPLPSWYGGEYRPACMNNPDWRTYEKEMVRRQLDAGCDGIFFDNPTVHPQGCYCDHCMRKFAAFLARDEKGSVAKGAGGPGPGGDDVRSWRQLALRRREDFLRFRCTIAADFLAEMRAYARAIKPNALVTCNNSLNSPDVFYSQCRTYGYNIEQLSRVEDFVVVEDMATQPRLLENGGYVEYGPVYEMLHAISHRKPVVAVALAGGDYHTPPHLMRLAMAEAAAHGASYLSWPTWPPGERDRMIEAVRPQAEWLRGNAELLNGTTPCADVALFLPFHQWLSRTDCPALRAAKALGRENVQFRVVSEEDLDDVLTKDAKDAKDAKGSPPVLVTPSPDALGAKATSIDRYKRRGGRVVSIGEKEEEKTWLAEVTAAAEPSVVVNDARPGVRVVVREKGGRTIVHLLNLNVERISSFEDRVRPVNDVHLVLRCHGDVPASVTAITADADATAGAIRFGATSDAGAAVVGLVVPRLFVSTILVIR